MESNLKMDFLKSHMNTQKEERVEEGKYQNAQEELERQKQEALNDAGGEAHV